MKLMICRLQQGTFIGQIKTVAGYSKDNKEDQYNFEKLYFPAMVDFITMPAQSPLGKVEIKTTLHMADWPCSEMILDQKPILHSIIDTDQPGECKQIFVDAYLTCINQVWKSRKIVN